MTAWRPPGVDYVGARRRPPETPPAGRPPPAPRASGAGGSDLAFHEVKLRVERQPEGRNAGDADDRDQGDHQAVLDHRGPVLFLHEPLEQSRHGTFSFE